MNSNKNLDLARKAFPYNKDQRVAYMLGIEEGYNQAMQDFLEKACIWFTKHNKGQLFGQFERDMEKLIVEK